MRHRGQQLHQTQASRTPSPICERRARSYSPYLGRRRSSSPTTGTTTHSTHSRLYPGTAHAHSYPLRHPRDQHRKLTDPVPGQYLRGTAGIVVPEQPHAGTRSPPPAARGCCHSAVRPVRRLPPASPGCPLCGRAAPRSSECPARPYAAASLSASLRLRVSGEWSRGESLMASPSSGLPRHCRPRGAVRSRGGRCSEEVGRNPRNPSGAPRAARPAAGPRLLVPGRSVRVRSPSQCGARKRL